MRSHSSTCLLCLLNGLWKTTKQEFFWLSFNNDLHTVNPPCQNCGSVLNGKQLRVTMQFTSHVISQGAWSIFGRLLLFGMTPATETEQHNASIKPIRCYDKCTAQVSLPPAAFQWQAAVNRSTDQEAKVIKFDVWLQYCEGKTTFH